MMYVRLSTLALLHHPHVNAAPNRAENGVVAESTDAHTRASVLARHVTSRLGCVTSRRGQPLPRNSAASAHALRACYLAENRRGPCVKPSRTCPLGLARSGSQASQHTPTHSSVVVLTSGKNQKMFERCVWVRTRHFTDANSTCR